MIGIVAIMGVTDIVIGIGTEGVRHAHHQALHACLHAPLTNPAGSLGPQGQSCEMNFLEDAQKHPQRSIHIKNASSLSRTCLDIMQVVGTRLIEYSFSALNSMMEEGISSMVSELALRHRRVICWNHDQ